MVTSQNDADTGAEIVEVDDDSLDRSVSPVPRPRKTVADNADRSFVIDLDAVRESLGAKWPNVEVRAMQIAEASLQSQLKPCDRLWRNGDGNFEIAFGDRDAVAGAQAAGGLTAMVHAKLVGEQAFHGADGHDSTPTVKERSEPLETREAMSRLLSRSSKRAEFIKSETSRILKELCDNGRISFAPVIGVGSRRSANLRLASFDRAWSTAIDYLLQLNGDDASIRFELDLVLLGHVAHHLMEKAASLRDSIAVPVHYGTICEPPLATRFLDFCQEIPSDIRDRISLNISGIGGDDMLSPWAEAVLACHSRLRMIRIEEPRLQVDLAAERIGIVSIRFEDIQADLWSDQEYLRQFIKEIHDAECRLLMSDIPHEFLALAREIRPDFLSPRNESIPRF